MVRGGAAAGDPTDLRSLAAQPRVQRALFRSSCAVAGVGIAIAGVSSLGSGLITSAASAAYGAGGSTTSGGSRAIEVGLLADPNAPIEVAHIDELTVPTPAAITEDATALAGVAPVEAVAEQAAAPVAEALPPLVLPTSPPAPAPAASSVPAPEPDPAPAPEPMPAASPVAAEAQSVEDIIREIFGEHADSAIGVANCESRLNPAAVSRGGGNWGLFQINKVHRGRVEAMGYSWDQILDARVNTIVAKSIFDEQGWRPWGCRHAA
jgi:hypothetical protein